MKRACDHFLDLKGAESPLSLLRVIEAFKAMKPKETLEVLGDDPDTRRGFFKVLRASSYHLISEEDLPGDISSFRIRIRKERDTLVPDLTVE